MATMVKEKRREKKKSKEKHVPKSSVELEQPSVSDETEVNEDSASDSKNTLDLVQNPTDSDFNASTSTEKHMAFDNCGDKQKGTVTDTLVTETATICKENYSITQALSDTKVTTTEYQNWEVIKSQLIKANEIGNTYEDLNSKLKRMAIPSLYPDLTEIESRIESTLTNMDQEAKEAIPTSEGSTDIMLEAPVPSAPIFEEDLPEIIHHHEVTMPAQVVHKPAAPKLQCMPLEEAIKLYGGTEIAEVRALSDKEEAIVEAGPVSGPEHPLVDLLSTFRSSLIAADRERTQLMIGYAKEKKFRSTLWKVEKRTAYVSERCPCGLTVRHTICFDVAELMKDRLPVAKMRLEVLLRDVQDSYCHHQHAALLAHCQIEELISETTQGSKNDIREALALILQTLRLSDGTVPALAVALQRWARALTAALLDARDLRQLLYLLHQLFRQTRSVRWAAHIIHVTVGDRVAAARALALLDLLLARPKLEAAQECTEDTEEAWEEVDKHGSGGAVSEGTLRERDLLALLRAFPLRDLVARLALFTHCDVSQAREHEWGDPSGGGGVLRACCGARALLATLQNAVAAHAHYSRLLAVLRSLASRALHALAALHLHCRDSYTIELELRVTSELEAAFAAGFTLLGVSELNRLPATLLRDDTAKDYCTGIIVGLHDKSPKQLDSLSIELPVLPCGDRVRILTQAALDRTQDNELARMVLDFLFQTGIKRKTPACKGSCEAVARELLPSLLATHAYLHTVALHVLADLYQVDPLEPSAIVPLSVETWRPSIGEANEVLNDWAQRCPPLLSPLLLHMDYTAHSGVSLETQLAIGSWLCHWTQQALSIPEWAWQVLRRLRVHRTCWGEPLDAPAPFEEPTDLFGMAYAVLSSAWGHCIPLICSQGMAALCRIAAVRAADATHCLAPVMLVMVQSPESVSLTPLFQELFSILLSSGPTLMQRALGRGPVSGSDLLLKLILTQLDGKRYMGVSRNALLSTWLHALWRPPLPAAGLLDAALLASRGWTQFDLHAKLLLQEENYKEHISHAVRNVAHAPLLCECLLRAAHAQHEVATQLWPRLQLALHTQHSSGARIHVQNALKEIGANMSAEELVIYRTAAAVLSAPLQHPSHLTLWRLFFHLYLQRPPNSLHDSVPPVGPLFFSGLIKSRTLSQLKRRLQDTTTYHHNERAALQPKGKDTSPKETSSTATPRTSPANDNNLLPELTIIDLTGESSESSDSESSSEEEVEPTEEWTVILTEETNLMSYHANAETMMRDCARWLDHGDKVRAMPYHADIARNITEDGLDAAWSRELSRRPLAPDGDPLPLPSDSTPPPPAPRRTPLRDAVAAILAIKDRSTKRSRNSTIKSPLEDVDFKDVRSLLKLVEKYLNDIIRLAVEWSSEVSRVSSLDSKLWEHVCALRVSQPILAVRKSCVNKCDPIPFTIQERQWCISNAAEQGIKENRSSARAGLRRLARPRPHAARTAAALHTVARRIRSAEAARHVAQSAWQCAGQIGACAPAHAALSALLAELSERWLCHDGKLCTDLLSRWSNNSTTSLQQSLCGTLVSPRSLRPADWPPVYMTLLGSKLPSHAVFSYLSKFEMARWSEVAEPAQRRDVLEALLTAAQRWGATPDSDHHVLLELIGVHTATVVSAHELCAHASRCARACVAARLPPAHCAHLLRAVERTGRLVPFDQLGHLLRELGVFWWEARSGLKGRNTNYALYAKHTAALLHALQRAFVAAGVELTYAPEKVARYAWSTLQESWAPWVSPHPALPPLLPSTVDEEAYTPMLKHFIDNIHQIMLDCPGTEEYLLQQVFVWTIQTYLGVNNEGTSQESRVQLSALLAELVKLPWLEHQWMSVDCHQSLLQICANPDKEMTAWCGATLRHVAAETWLRDVTHDQLGTRLSTLLHVFTGLPHAHQTLEEATRLPWFRLPEAALDEALERFFAQYFNPAIPYHELPQFRIILYASELLIHEGTPPQQLCGSLSRQKRELAISQWVRAACAPALSAHAAGHSGCMLSTISDTAQYLERSEGETEELLSRAAVIMCLEPAAAAALPVWIKWVQCAPPRLAGACLTAAGVLTSFEYFAALGDAAARALLAHRETVGWVEICHRWRACHWTDAAPLVARTRLHAAYGLARTHPQPYHALRTALLALLAANVNFIENEAIVAVWICFACRVARECAGEGERGECAGAACSLLARWGGEPRRSLLRVVTLQTDTGSPTPQHRLLCRLAQCIVTPGSESAVRAYETSCAAVLGSTPDVLPWGRQPHPRRLPRLAMRLYPVAEKYFKEELESAPEG